MADFPTLTVSFDDGRTVIVETKARDMAIAERDFGHDYQKAGPFVSLYATALGALSRLKRAGSFEGDLPASVDALLDIADVSAEDAPDAEGNVSDPAPTTG